MGQIASGPIILATFSIGITVVFFHPWGKTYVLKIVSTIRENISGIMLNSNFNVLEAIRGSPLDLKTCIFLTQCNIS